MEGEGILPAQLEAVQSLIKSIEHNGAETICVIAFGSRAKQLANPESDLDVFFLVDFNNGNSDLLSDAALKQAKYTGQATVEKAGQAGTLQMFVYSQDGFTDRLKGYPDINKSALFKGLATDGLVLAGEEPIIDGVPFINYLQSRLKLDRS